MKLKKVLIYNFRSIKKAEIDFSENPRVLVGMNEAGKTNILHALRLIDDQFSIQNQDIRETSLEKERIDEAYIKFLFEFEEEEIKDIYQQIKKEILMRDEKSKLFKKGNQEYCNLYELIKLEFNSGVYKIDLLEEDKSAKYFGVEDVDLIKEFRKPKPNVNYTFTHPQIGSINISQFKLINYSEFKPQINEQYLDTATFEDFEDLISEKIIEKIEEKLPDVIYWEYKDEYLLPPSISIDEFVRDLNTCIPLKNLFLIANIKESEISKYITTGRRNFNTFRSRLNKIAEAATKFFRKAWPEYKTIKFNLYPTETQIKCGVEEKNIWDFQRRSDGFKRFVSLLLSLSIPSESGLLNNALILIDDADTNLHPSGAKYLMKQLKKIAKNNYVVYATHSIFMIDRENIQRHYIVSKKNEITLIEEATEETFCDDEVLYKALGASVYEILNEKNILFEGWTDKKLFFTSLEKFKKYEKFFKKIGISHAGGVRTIKNVVPLLEMGNRKCLIISDADKPAIEAQKEHNENKRWGVWKTYNDLSEKIYAEDFIKEEILNEKLKKVLKDFNIELKEDDFKFPQNNRIFALKEFLKNHGSIPKEKIKDIIKKFKEFVFDELKPQEIEDSYLGILEKIKKEINKL